MFGRIWNWTDGLALHQEEDKPRTDIMKVLQTIYDLTALSGGPSTCVCDIMQGLFDIGAPVELLTVRPGDNGMKNLGDGSEWLKEVAYDYRTPIRYSRNIRTALKQSNYDLYHANTLWTDATHSTCAHARKVGKPYILSPHGMLYPTALAISKWKKELMLGLWFNKDIREAACLHATCHQEMEYCRSFGYKGPIAVIPNAVVFPEGVELKKEGYKDAKGRRAIGFLGRLHPIKKVENILYAMAMLPSASKKRLSLEIMGKYDDRYEAWLKDEVNRLSLNDCVEFVGFVSGKQKYDRLSNLSALMVPSEQENFGMIVPEALICGTPVYASLGTPWSELNDYNAGWWGNNDPAAIAQVINEILSSTDDQLLEKGCNGRKLMEEKYEQHKVATLMNQLYEWLVNGGNRPDFVYV